MKQKLKKVYTLFKEFNFRFSVKWCFYRLTKQYGKYVDLVYNYLCNYLSEEIDSYNSNIKTIKNLGVVKTVWFCWWQGFDSMPNFCRMCYKQLKKVLTSDIQLILISKENYRDYTNIPNYIIDKLEKGTISITQFSDILRQSLILENGGMWIDASVWCNDKIDEIFEWEGEFWSVKLEKPDDPNVWGQVISQCKWNGFLLGGLKGSKIYEFVFNSMCKYYKEHDFTIDYFIQNMLIRVAYENIADIKVAIDKVPTSNRHLYDLYRVMDEPFDLEVWNEYTSNTKFFKFTQKRVYREFNEGQPTFYKYLKEMVDRKIKK